jgi:hypothetical protein
MASTSGFETTIFDGRRVPRQRQQKSPFLKVAPLFYPI